MLTLYNYLESIIEEQNGRQWYFETRLVHFASDIFDVLGIRDPEDRILAFDRTIRACKSLGIPIAANFKKIYCSDGNGIIADWKISPLACYLITINCDPGNTNVARAQLFFAMNQVGQNTQH